MYTYKLKYSKANKKMHIEAIYFLFIYTTYEIRKMLSALLFMYLYTLTWFNVLSVFSSL